MESGIDASKNEQTAILLEQEHVHEALMRSKSDMLAGPAAGRLIIVSSVVVAR